MTELLLKWFVPALKTENSAEVRAGVGVLSGTVGIFCNLLLFAGKLAVGLLTGALSVTADALNNLSDASGSILTLVGFRLAGKPADDRHPYGHARFEYLSALAVSAMILLIGLELGLSSLRKILKPSPVAFTPVSFGVLLVSIGVKLWLSRFNRKLGTRIGSDALLAVSADSRNDCIATAAVLLAAALEHWADLRADGFMGLGVAGFILVSGWSLARKTISPLLGENADPELRQKILSLIQTGPGVLGYHDLMVHDYGPGRQYATVHVEMDSREDPLLCHEVIDTMEYECRKKLGVHLVIHYDPILTHDPEGNRLKQAAEEILLQYDPRLRLHDFRIVPGRTHRNLIFDVPLPRDLRERAPEILHKVEEALNGREEGAFHVKITFDFPEA